MRKTTPKRPGTLSEDDLRRIGEALESALHRRTYDLIVRIRADVIDELRFAPLAAEIGEARGRRGLDIRAAAKALNVPQYEIQNIERGNVAEIRPGLLERYAVVLGMADGLGRWKRANPELALRLGRPKGQLPLPTMFDQQMLAEALQVPISSRAPAVATTRPSARPATDLDTRTLQLKIVLEDTDPPIWRRVLVPCDATLGGLHRVIQTTMGWHDSHLYQFEIGGARYSDPELMDDPEPDERDACRTRLSDLGLTPRSSFHYEYDFGDGWGHRITVERIRDEKPGVVTPACIGGARACPPEDCGGPAGYQDLLGVLADPSHPEHDERRAWIRGGFDPEAFDVASVNEILARSAGRRRKK